MRKLLLLLLLLLCQLVLQGCTSKSTFTAVQEDVSIKIGKTDIEGELPITGDINRTTFGRYPMMISKEGYDPMYCNVPMVVSAGYIIADVLFFAPAAFFNSNGSLPFYLIDIKERTIKYKKDDSGEWIVYPIQKAESDSVQNWFSQQEF